MEHSGSFLLVGGSGGIGRAVARELLAQGHRVALAGRDTDRLQQAAAQLADAGPCGPPSTHRVDATDFDAVEALVRAVVEAQGRLDGAANLAGSILLKPVAMTSAAEFAHTIAQNATTAFALVRAASKPIIASGGGSIVLMTSAAARIGLVNHEAIAAAKGAVAGLTLAAAASGAASGLRVNAVAPGLVDTPMAERLTRSPSARAASEAMHPMGRIGTPDDLAGLIAWLLGPRSSWITGQIIAADGGLSALKAPARPSSPAAPNLPHP